MQAYPPIILKTTEDGSSTLYRPDLDEHYHSIHGAIQESMHVFIRAGLYFYFEYKNNENFMNKNTSYNTITNEAIQPAKPSIF